MTRRNNRPTRTHAIHDLERGSVREGLNATKDPTPAAHHIIERAVERSGLSYEGFVKHITQTALSSLCVWSESDLKRLLMAAERLGLDPLNNEIYGAQGGGNPYNQQKIYLNQTHLRETKTNYSFFDSLRNMAKNHQIAKTLTLYARRVSLFL
jgi:hypothetical protein